MFRIFYFKKWRFTAFRIFFFRRFSCEEFASKITVSRATRGKRNHLALSSRRRGVEPTTTAVVRTGAGIDSASIWSSTYMSFSRSTGPCRQSLPLEPTSSATRSRGSPRGRGPYARAAQMPWWRSEKGIRSGWQSAVTSFGACAGTAPIPQKGIYLSHTSIKSVSVICVY